MPNHYHLLVRQDGEGAISDMMQAFGTSLSKTYNKKYQTVGSLFQGKFRDEHVGDTGYLMYLARYFHRNPVKALLCRAPEDWEFSNYREVLGLRHGTLCDFSPVLACFANQVKSKTSVSGGDDPPRLGRGITTPGSRRQTQRLRHYDQNL